MNQTVKRIIQSAVGIILLFLAYVLLKSDFRSFLYWWLALLALGLLFMPAAHRIFRDFFDRGYLFSKALGLAVSGYLMWLASSLKILKFTSFSCVAIVLVCFVVNLLLFFFSGRKKGGETSLEGKFLGEESKKRKGRGLFSKDILDSVITEELLFFAFFLVWTYIRGFKPEAYGTEKFMDYAFMNIMMKSSYMPPKDVWFAGSNINYYYVGQFMATFMTKLSFVSVKVGYNLMLMTLAAFAFMLPYSLVCNVTRDYYESKGVQGRKAPVFAGLLSGAGVSFAANLHFSIFYWIVPRICKMIGYDGDYSKYWFPDSTRYIGYNPDTKDKTIHEYPNYSFVLGDLHAHVVNIVFVFTVLALLYGWLQCQKRKRETDDRREKPLKTRELLLREILNPYIILTGFFIGLFHTTNFWDFPIYYVVAGAVILFSNARVFRFEKKALWITAVQGIFIILLGNLVALPFTLSFDQISTQICLAVAHTPLYQLLILWGLPISLVIGLFTGLILQYKKKVKAGEVPTVREELSDKGKKKKVGKLFPFLKGFLEDLNVPDLYILTLGLCAIGLVLLPEVIYIKDIYSGDYKRANTMFKLTYQAFILFGISMGFIFVKYLNKRERIKKKILILIPFLLFLSTLWYPKVAIKDWYGNVFNIKNYKGLDATAFMETTMPDDYLATNWMQKYIKGTPIILEANGDSYTDYERVSVITGLPTVLGWYVHEWLWRGDTKEEDQRVEDIKTIYTSENTTQVTSLIDKYKIEYIYVGKLERDKFTHVNDKLLKGLGEVVFDSVATPEKDYETYIVRVEPKG